ncbi:MAG: histidine kinase [Porphyromonadaceae bacterium]|nr:MAG: histidine kinase [Porphyromonadaceae bacterium]
MDFENHYTLLSHQLEEFTRSGSAEKMQNPMDSLPRFIKELGNPDGYKSEAYKEFICDFIDAYRSTQFLKLFGYSEEREVDLSTALLTGWDLYWYLAHLAERELGTFPGRGYDAIYKRFSDLYPGTEFHTELVTIYKVTEKGRIGSPVPDMKFLDYRGKRHSTEEVQGQNWCFFNLYSYRELDEFVSRWIGPFQKEYPYKFTFILSAHQCSQQEIDSLARKCASKTVILLGISDRNKEIVSYLESLPPRLVFIDRNGKIAYHGLFRTRLVPNYLTWPDPSRFKTKTFPLTVFWYSLGGASVGALIIPLIFRIRSKRKEKRLILKRKMAQLEVDAVRSRMNPHFLFNALSSIQNLINKKQIEEANLFLARFGTRPVCNRSASTLDSAACGKCRDARNIRTG